MEIGAPFQEGRTRDNRCCCSPAGALHSACDVMCRRATCNARGTNMRSAACSAQHATHKCNTQRLPCASVCAARDRTASGNAATMMCRPALPSNPATGLSQYASPCVLEQVLRARFGRQSHTTRALPYAVCPAQDCPSFSKSAKRERCALPTAVPSEYSPGRPVGYPCAPTLWLGPSGDFVLCQRLRLVRQNVHVEAHMPVVPCFTDACMQLQQAMDKCDLQCSCNAQGKAKVGRSKSTRWLCATRPGTTSSLGTRSRNVQHTTCSMQRAILNLQHATCNKPMRQRMQSSIRNAACDVANANDLQPSAALALRSWLCTGTSPTPSGWRQRWDARGLAG